MPGGHLCERSLSLAGIPTLHRSVLGHGDRRGGRGKTLKPLRVIVLKSQLKFFKSKLAPLRAPQGSGVTGTGAGSGPVAQCSLAVPDGTSPLPPACLPLCRAGLSDSVAVSHVGLSKFKILS